MEDNDLQGLDRFRPSGNTKIKKSISKRVAAFIFVGAGAALAMIMLAIAGSEQIVNSSAPPKEVIEPSVSKGIIPPIELRQPEPEKEEEEEEKNYTTYPAAVQPQIQPNMPPVVLPQMQPPVIQQPIRTTVIPAYGRRETRRPYVTMNRRTAQETRLQAASAPTAVSNFVGGGQQGANGMAGVEALDAALDTSPNSSSNSNMMDMGTSGTSNVTAISDPNGWSRKEAFLNQASPNEYSRNNVMFPRSNFEVKAGTIIPCVLISGLNSDLPGNATAQVSENVWDTATGKYLLIPRGSRLVGTYDNQITYGQNRALVIWSRVIFPDGSSLTLDNLKGSDQSGYAGFKGEVNHHWNSIISSALLVSLVGAGAQVVQDDSNNNNNNNNNSNRRSFGDVLSERVATSIADAMTQIIQRNVQRQPTIKIKPGYRFTIFVQHDIVFPGSWRR